MYSVTSEPQNGTKCHKAGSIGKLFDLAKRAPQANKLSLLREKCGDGRNGK